MFAPSAGWDHPLWEHRGCTSDWNKSQFNQPSHSTSQNSFIIHKNCSKQKYSETSGGKNNPGRQCLISFRTFWDQWCLWSQTSTSRTIGIHRPCKGSKYTCGKLWPIAEPPENDMIGQAAVKNAHEPKEDGSKCKWGGGEEGLSGRTVRINATWVQGKWMQSHWCSQLAANKGSHRNPKLFLKAAVLATFDWISFDHAIVSAGAFWKKASWVNYGGA